MKSYQFHFPASGEPTLTIPLPEELRGNKIEVILLKKPRHSKLLENDDDFWRTKSLDEIAAEQGGPKIHTDSDKYFGFLSDFMGL